LADKLSGGGEGAQKIKFAGTIDCFVGSKKRIFSRFQKSAAA